MRSSNSLSDTRHDSVLNTASSRPVKPAAFAYCQMSAMTTSFSTTVKFFISNCECAAFE